MEVIPSITSDLKVKFLKASNGDSILVSFLENDIHRNILIDGGVPKTYWNSKNKKGKPEPGALKETIDYLRDKNEKIDLLVMTHVDDDHIGGVLKWFEKDPHAYLMIDKVWFNSGKLIAKFFESKELAENELRLNISTNTNTSIGQGIQFEEYLKEKNIWEEKIINDKQLIDKFSINFKILSPSPEKLEALLKKWEKEKPDYFTSAGENDYATSLREHIENDSFEEDVAAHNGSSIAFIMVYNQMNLLFLADAHPSVIVQSLSHFGYSNENPLKAVLVKISHHGSKSNNSKEMLDMIQSDTFVISTNGDKHNHPHKQFLARLINMQSDCKIYFNYPELLENNKIFSPQDFKDFPNFRALPIGFSDNSYFQLLNNKLIVEEFDPTGDASNSLT